MTTEEAAPGSTDAPSPIPIPPGFPVTWEQPDDEAKFWNQDRMHFPEPSTPLMEAFSTSFNAGFDRAAEALELPVRMSYRNINTYVYSAMTLAVPPAELEAQGEKAQKKIGEGMAKLQEWWETELLPEVKEHLAWWEAFDLEAASTTELLAHLDETLDRLTRLWDIHFLIAFPFLIAPSLFDDMYEDVFGRETTFDAYRLLQGFGNKTVDSGHALWALSREALANPNVRQVIESNEAAAVPAALEASEEGRAFLGKLRAYLEEYGQRSDVFAELGSYHWIEDPTTPINNLKDYITQPDRDLRADLAALADERERLIGEARERIKSYPEAAKGEFEFLLKAAQAGTIIQEDHNHWIDQRGTYKVRLVMLEFGNRFAAAGAIAEPNDVFYLKMDELHETANQLEGADRKQIAAERKAEMEHFRGITAPPALGTPPAGPPPDDPISNAMGRFWGAPVPQSEDPSVINGNAGAPGKVTGIAKVVANLSEAGKVNPGEILVAPSTMPAWTPLFASIAAVVTDAGGVLSHAAIVAREYNIPAVLGTGNATALIKDGQTIEVDGDEGVVRIVS